MSGEAPDLSSFGLPSNFGGKAEVKPAKAKPTPKPTAPASVPVPALAPAPTDAATEAPARPTDQGWGKRIAGGAVDDHGGGSRGRGRGGRGGRGARGGRGQRGGRGRGGHREDGDGSFKRPRQDEDKTPRSFFHPSMLDNPWRHLETTS